MAMPVVLARRSVVGRRHEIADSGAFGGTHSTGCRARFWVRCGPAQAASVLGPVAAPATAQLGHPLCRHAPGSEAVRGSDRDRPL